ncbi:ATP-grasp fold amidoligase family protein [Maribacter sp. HTCC2170]|uniref:ATP-grasp fold amidoligase family protein n=1 Tax=Maribacter sp. (strain HTCC2170 / KCCM 42371) TaxID=313603 RepID=UPI00006B48F4|nr:ATP-grasp fold amidoligase family protein [Maribacter sp. HTCC2170]EAR01091.1 hypothetical protein FB2170_09976 [Maribacter sp. HTCC2170]
MLKFINYIYHKTLFGYILRYVYYTLRYWLVPDKTHQQIRFKKKHGYRLNLKDPKTLNEKIVWLKLNHKTPLHTQCADKYEVRKYVAEKIDEAYLVPLYYDTFNPEDIVPENLPDTPCIIKANHDSSGGIFVYDKNNVPWEKVQKNLKKRMARNYYWNSKEWQYKNIKPRIIVEKLLLDKKGQIPFDYKLHCFNGKVRMIQVDMGRGTEEHCRNWYNTNWEREPYKWSANKGNGVFTDPTDQEIRKPETLQKMIELSQVLATPFPYVRVDWYDVDGQLYFGELTFHHDGGMQPILPKTWDAKLGAEVILT